MPMPFSGPLVVVWGLSEAENCDFSVYMKMEENSIIYIGIESLDDLESLAPLRLP